ncbi:ferritin-like domain-containing protein [Desulfopila inferna]|uniref:ferritin-like domain-containing protein n=1 Tax=Desulfopila inferna TaxID=468528 RepID=UPI0019641488|nr:ferritin family protein [Desulfopila inferna]MBM9604961.1 ferritin family protein [Desulfopila inferna]
MDIYIFAMQMEKDGELYYRELAEKSKSEGLRKIFTMLAEEEIKHFKIVKDLREKTGLSEVVDTAILSDVKNIFEEMREGNLAFEQGLYVDTTEETNAYRKARDIEESSKDFYLEKAEESVGQPAELLFKKLAREEDKHFRIMDNIVEFVSRPEPGNWLEDAEFYHLDQY